MAWSPIYTKIDNLRREMWEGSTSADDVLEKVEIELEGLLTAGEKARLHGFSIIAHSLRSDLEAAEAAYARAIHFANLPRNRRMDGILAEIEGQYADFKLTHIGVDGTPEISMIIEKALKHCSRLELNVESTSHKVTRRRRRWYRRTYAACSVTAGDICRIGGDLAAAWAHARRAVELSHVNSLPWFAALSLTGVLALNGTQAMVQQALALLSVVRMQTKPKSQQRAKIDWAEALCMVRFGASEVAIRKLELALPHLRQADRALAIEHLVWIVAKICQQPGRAALLEKTLTS